jgi:hypothetical protein
VTQLPFQFDRPASLTPDSVRLNRQCHAILARLRQGPATNAELSQIALRFGGRLFEIRKAGAQIVTDKQAGGLVVYSLRKDSEC